jgi:hypothetical protein
MQKTHVVMLLDESGSMGSHRHSVVTSFNDYVSSLKKETKRCFISLYKFDASLNNPVLRKVFKNRKVKECYALTMDQYTPRGGTPLYDAMGMLIEKTKDRLPKEAKVLFVVHTDGWENASQQFNKERIKNMVKRLEKKRGWTFVYLGEGEQAWNAGYDFGIDNVANFSSNLRGAAMSNLAQATTTYACSANVGGAMGATQSFYHDAGLDPDSVDPEDILKSTSSVALNSDTEADSS